MGWSACELPKTRSKILEGVGLDRSIYGLHDPAVPFLQGARNLESAEWPKLGASWVAGHRRNGHRFGKKRGVNSFKKNANFCITQTE
jgi:hypothetical protein